MKTFTLFLLIITALILGVTTRALLTGPGEEERLRFSETYVCPDGSQYRFDTRSAPFFDPQTSIAVTGRELKIDCVNDGLVTLAGVTRQAEGIFLWAAIGGWFGVLMLVRHLMSLLVRLRPSAPMPPSPPIGLTVAEQQQLLAHLQAGRKIAAVKHVRTVANSSLADAKAYVDQMEKQIPK